MRQNCTVIMTIHMPLTFLKIIQSPFLNYTCPIKCNCTYSIHAVHSDQLCFSLMCNMNDLLLLKWK
jgi:hypothetical protein